MSNRSNALRVIAAAVRHAAGPDKGEAALTVSAHLPLKKLVRPAIKAVAEFGKAVPKSTIDFTAKAVVPAAQTVSTRSAFPYIPTILSVLLSPQTANAGADVDWMKPLLEEDRLKRQVPRLLPIRWLRIYCGIKRRW